MTTIESQLAAKTALEDSQKEASRAIEQFNAEQMNYKERFLVIVDRIALFSVGTISLSVTFFGYLLSVNRLVLHVILFGIPLYYYLYSSWILLLASSVSCLIYRLVDAQYLFYGAQHYMQKARKKSHEALSRIYESDYPIIFSQDTTREKEIATAKKNVEILENIIGRTSKKENFLFTFSQWCKFCVGLFFVGGLVFLVVFAVVSTYRLV